MKALRSRPVTVWCVLVAATLISVWIATAHPLGVDGDAAATGISLAIAFAKALLIGMDFMEVRGSAPALRIIFLAWIVVFGTATVALATS